MNFSLFVHCGRTQHRESIPCKQEYEMWEYNAHTTFKWRFASLQKVDFREAKKLKLISEHCIIRATKICKTVVAVKVFEVWKFPSPHEFNFSWWFSILVFLFPFQPFNFHKMMISLSNGKGLLQEASSSPSPFLWKSGRSQLKQTNGAEQTSEKAKLNREIIKFLDALRVKRHFERVVLSSFNSLSYPAPKYQRESIIFSFSRFP